MELFRYGVKLEERVGDFQREVMYATLIRGLFLVGLQSLASTLLGLNGTYIGAVIFSLVYIIYIKGKYKKLNVYLGHEVYSYKGNIRNFRDDNPTDGELKLENQFRKFMALMSTGFVAIGMFLSDTLHILGQEYKVTLGLVLLSIAVTVIGVFPLLYLYLYGYKWMVRFYVMALENPIIATIYTFKQMDGEDVPSIEEYAEWKNTKERKRDKKYSTEVNATLQQFHNEVEEEIAENVEIYAVHKRYIEVEPEEKTPQEIEVELKDELKDKEVGKSKHETLKEFDIEELDETYDTKGEENEK